MVVKIDGKYFRFSRVRSPRYIVRVGFDVYTADTQSEVSVILDAFVGIDDLRKVEVIEVASVQRLASF